MKRTWKSPTCLALALLFVFCQKGSLFAASQLPISSQQKSAALADNDNTVYSLTDLGFSDTIELSGAYQSVSADFSLPYEWDLSGDILVELTINSNFQSLMEALIPQSFEDQLVNQFGILGLEINGRKAAEERITQNGSTVIRFNIPSDLFIENAQTNTLTFSWDASTSCQQSISANAIIDGDSTVTFSLQTSRVNYQMQYFPAPFYAPGLIASYPTALLIPPDPDVDTLSALVAVAAGMGRQSGGEIDLEVYTTNKIPDSVLKSHHLILVGKDAVLDSIARFKDAGNDLAFYPADASQDEGYLTFSPSPWNNERAILVVSGANGTALRKASAAIGADTLFSTGDETQVVISNISEPLDKQQWQIDQTFSSIFNQQEINITTLGSESASFSFHVPADMILSPETYLELYFRHSQLINYLQSSVSVAINDRTIGTIRFSDQTATNGLTRIIIPPNILRPLQNTLTLTFTITPQDLCADERSGNYWVTIFGDSYLHLPPTLEASPLAEQIYLGDLRNTFFGTTSFEDLSFVVGNDDIASFQAATDVALQLGSLTLANQFLVDGLYFEGASIEKNENAIILISESDQIAMNEMINGMLPMPFDPGGEIMQIASDGISFSLDKGQNYGIVQVVERDDGFKPILLLSGNSAQGLSLAASEVAVKLLAPSGERSNVEVINTSGESHPFLIETDAAGTADDQEASQQGWQQLFADGHSNQLALYLMVAALILTALYSIFAFTRFRKKK